MEIARKYYFIYIFIHIWYHGIYRHDEIWPELVELLNSTGVKDYTIFLDEESLM